MLETGLTLNGFRVTSARNGREALEPATAETFDAVLSDIYMPDLGRPGTGGRIARRLPESSDRPHDRAGLACRWPWKR